jgi:inosine/xanthosine triphosphatase
MQIDASRSIIVTSLNEAKIGSVWKVANEFFPELIGAIGVQSESLVSETPIGDEEAIAGCSNRIPFARRAHPDAAFYASIEGAIDFNQHGAFVFSWVLIEQRDPFRQALGCSAKVQLPPVLAETVRSGISLSELTKKTYRSSENIANLGTNGVVTKGAFTRSDEFETALRCAFGFLANALNY